MIKIRQIEIGSGMPKICVPITGRTMEAIEQQAKTISEYDVVDIVEWRVDYADFIENYESVKAALVKLRALLGEKVLLFTFRTAGEGGEKVITANDYYALNRFATGTGLVDMIDIEMFLQEEGLGSYIDMIHSMGCKVILSNHDFTKTPDEQDIVDRLCKMEQVGGDILKIAVMPNSPMDVVTLLGATCKAGAMVKQPVVTMSMAKLGTVSRVTGEIFGSAITFGTIGKESAPGQVPVEQLSSYLQIFH